MEIAEAVAERIKTLCKERGISINKLATLSGLTQSTVDSIIRGKSRNPRLATIQKICDGFDMTLQEFFDDPVFENLEVD